MAKEGFWSVMLVDDDVDMCNMIKEFIEEARVTSEGDAALVSIIPEFADALNRLASSRFDLVILDVRQGGYELNPGDEAGAKLLKEIMSTRFLPVIFYTGLPTLVKHLENAPFIQVVAKGGTHEPLLKAVRIIMRSELPLMNRALVNHIDKIQREYMWKFVAKNWESITAETDRASVAFLLARRLASSLSDPSATQFAQDLGSVLNASTESDKVHAMQYYVMPPIAEPPMMAGDIYKGTVNAQDGYWVMVTPSCDLVQDKAEWLLLAICDPLLEQREYVKWVGARSKSSATRLRELLGNNRRGSQRERHFYLPAAMSIPDLVVDLQNVAAIQPKEFGSLGLERLATLDSPFAEALTSQFSRLFGRIGTPGLDVNLVMARLESGSVN